MFLASILMKSTMQTIEQVHHDVKSPDAGIAPACAMGGQNDARALGHAMSQILSTLHCRCCL